MKLLLFLLAQFTNSAHAAGTDWREYCAALHWACSGVVGDDLMSRLANQAIAVMQTLIGGAAVVGVLWGAFLIASSGANEEGRTKGKNIIVTVLIGTALAILASAILNFIINAYSIL